MHFVEVIDGLCKIFAKHHHKYLNYTKVHHRFPLLFEVLKPPSAASESQSRRVNHLKGARLHYSDKSLDFSGGNFETNEVQIGLKAHNDHLNFNKHVCLHPFPRSHFLLITTEH